MSGRKPHLLANQVGSCWSAMSAGRGCINDLTQKFPLRQFLSAGVMQDKKEAHSGIFPKSFGVFLLYYPAVACSCSLLADAASLHSLVLLRAHGMVHKVA